MTGQWKQSSKNWRSLVSVATMVVLFATTGCIPQLPTPPPPPPPSPAPDPGPPTEESLETFGPFEVKTRGVNGSGFNDGTVYYPADADGAVPVMIAIPGFGSAEDILGWMGPRIASHGIAVFTLAPEFRNDFPNSRARQLNGALSWLTNDVAQESSPLFGLIDTSRVAFSGHSMGGGASTLAVQGNPAIKTVIPLAPWLQDPDVGPLGIPTLVVACEDDNVARVSAHARPIYNSMDEEKMFLEFADAPHGCPVGDSDNIPVLGRFMIAWLKVFLEDDASYDPFVCGPGLTDSSISRLESTCPVL